MFDDRMTEDEHDQLTLLAANLAEYMESDRFDIDAIEDFQQHYDPTNTQHFWMMVQMCNMYRDSGRHLGPAGDATEGHGKSWES